jgi:phage gp36-like protein
MAKENKQKTEATPVAITPENIVDQRKAGNLLTPELKKMMDEQTQKEKDEKIVRETKRRISYIGFRFDSGMVELKKMRAMDDLALYNTRQQGRLMRFLTGFVVTEQIANEFAAKTEDDVLQLEKVEKGSIILMVPESDKDGKTVRKEVTFKVGDEVPAIIDYNEFDDGLEKLQKNLRERQDKIEKQYKEDMLVIKKAAGEYWRDDWQYAARIITGEGVQSCRSW